jgi:hypothetical protein
LPGLLKRLRGKAEFYTNINFFTWNYDANLLYALKSFIAQKEKFTEVIRARQKEDYLEINDEIKLFNLNGFAIAKAIVR